MRMALIGPRGSGKSTVARLLAERLRYPLSSTDELVESAMGAPISQIVESKGWPAFRAGETQCLRQIINEDALDIIVDCGGGIIESEINRDLLAQLDCVVFLNAKPETLVKRLSGEMNERPSLTKSGDELAEMKRICSRRLPLYQQLADLEVKTTFLRPDEVASIIISSLNMIEG
jgi:shikimate kinase